MTDPAMRIQRQSVLLVEDDDPCRSSMTILLETCGFQVIPAEDGESAIERFQASGAEVGAVLLDIVLPGLGGYGTLRELRRLRNDLPVILTTGYDKEKVLKDFENVKFEGFISKPATSDMLTETLKPFIKSYGDDTCAQFDQATRRVLDALNKQFAVVEVEHCGDEWFVHVGKTEADELPVGFFGKTPYQAAVRLARALKVEFNDSEPT